ncbi:MAG: phosphoadenosine phosphosulfate reductase family protein [Patescibacteria group bacterium]
MKKLLEEKIKKAYLIIGEATKKFKKNEVVIAWTGGKDSTVVLHLVRTYFNGWIPFKVMFNDSTMEFQEIYNFVAQIKKQWNLDLIIEKHSSDDMKRFYKENDLEKKKEMSRIMKINAINNFLKEYDVDAFIVGIRRDEHQARSKEKYFSQRKNHVRIHPILDFTEKDVWDYTNKYKVPYVSLYKKGYRSLGEKPFTNKAVQGGTERSGREYDKEKTMEKLRNMGYW